MGGGGDGENPKMENHAGHPSYNETKRQKRKSIHFLKNFLRGGGGLL